VHRGIGAAAKLAELTSAALQRRQLRLQGLQAAQATNNLSVIKDMPKTAPALEYC
jgi:hypothetical protein